MTDKYTFISYSRKQLYFAEALTLHLQKHNIECWFDLQQLESGTDWAKALQNGYSNCDRLILVASSASLGSPYVAVEWETALKNGREVILAVFEEVEIPEKLKSAVTFDFRGNFNAKLKQLLAYLNGGPACHDPVPQPNRLEIPKRMPLDIWLMTVNALLPVLWIAVLPLVSWMALAHFGFTAVTMYLFALLIGVGYAFFFVLTFLRHTQGYDRLRGVVLFVLFAQVVLTFVNVVVLRKVSVLPFINDFASLTTIYSLYIYLVPLNRSGALLRWFPTGAAPQKMRRRIHGPLLKDDKKKEALRDQTAAQPVPVKFFIHYDPSDGPEVKKISRLLAKVGHQQTAEADATRQILLVTSHTSKKLVEYVSEKYGGDAIYILGSAINFDESLSKAGQFQWVDFRDNDKKDIEMLGRSMHDLKAWQRESALEATPTKFHEFGAPAMIGFLRLVGTIQAGSMLGSGLGYLILGGWSRLYAAVIELALGAAMYWLVERMIRRRANLVFYDVMVLLCMLVPGWLSSGGAAYYAPLIILAVTIPASLTWFPARAKPAPDEIGMDSDKKSRRWSRIIAGIIGVINFLTTIGLLILISKTAR